MAVQGLLLEAFGKFEDTISLKTWDAPPLQPWEVMIQVEGSPVNPADLNIIEGKYGRLPNLPATLGNEGTGCVIQVGTGCSRVKLEDTVVVRPGAQGMWVNRTVVKETDCFVVPNDIPITQRAMLVINPITAFKMIEGVRSGGWVIQNAANSAVGRSVVQLAKAQGVRSINFVRRPELIEELKKDGADHVFLDDEAGFVAAKEVLRHEQPLLGLNAVGGESALRVANLLALGGKLVTYGAMGRVPLKIPNGLLIFKNLSFTGFWVTAWLTTAPVEEVQKVVSTISTMMLSGALTLSIQRTFHLNEFAQALVEAGKSGRRGKIVFVIGG